MDSPTFDLPRSDSDSSAEAQAGTDRTTVSFGLLLMIVLFVAVPAVGVAWRLASGADFGGDSIHWVKDYDAGLSQSAQSGKPALLDFSATWCPPCESMRRNVWTDSKVIAAVAAGYVPVALDVSRQSTAESAQRYGIHTIPHILIVDSHGRVLREGAYMSASQMVEFLKFPPESK